MSTPIDATRPYINYSKAFSRNISGAMDSRRLDVLVLTPQDYIGILHDRSRHNPRLQAELHAILAQSTLGQSWTQAISPNAGTPWVAPAGLLANDAYLITKTLLALRIAGVGTFVKRTPKGTYIVIKGYAGLRNRLLQGTRFLTTHPRMVQMGLGMRGLQDVAKGGFILGLVVSAAVETLDFIFNDEKTMHDLVGGIGVEAVKAGLATMVGLGAGAWMASMTAIAIFPLTAVAVTVSIVGGGLNQLDKNWAIKENIISALRVAKNGRPHGIYLINEGMNVWKELKQNEKQESNKTILSTEEERILLRPIKIIH
jgi:hypothetical protein